MKAQKITFYVLSSIIFAACILLLFLFFSDVYLSGNYFIDLIIYYFDNNKSSFLYESIPCYEKGMAEYQKYISSLAIRGDGLMLPCIICLKESRILTILLSEIRKNGLNTKNCDFFVVGPVYGLFESMHKWEEAKDFLVYAEQYYNKDSFEYELIQGLIRAQKVFAVF